LERGFALVERDGVIVRDAREVQRDDAVRIRLGRGSLGATVTAVEEGGGETTADKTLKRPVTGVAEEPR
jgi:ribosomal 50S subunit-recycling heat shock protein